MVILDTDVNGKEINITLINKHMNMWQVQVKFLDMSNEHVKMKKKKNKEHIGLK